MIDYSHFIAILDEMATMISDISLSFETELPQFAIPNVRVKRCASGDMPGVVDI